MNVQHYVNFLKKMPDGKSRSNLFHRLPKDCEPDIFSCKVERIKIKESTFNGEYHNYDRKLKN